MPLAAVLPILSKFQNDLKVSEAILLKHFMSKTGATRKQDAFTPVVAASKSYVIKNEPFEAEIFLGSYSSTVDNLTVSVDGRPITVRDGKALFKLNPSSLGIKKHTAKISLLDPLTGETETFTKRFEFEVGERSATISADKMNVLYVGVENPLSISVAGVPSGQIQVRGEGVRLTKASNGKYITKPSRVGDAKITISGGGLEPTSFKYRVKRIPDPVSFEIARVPKNGDVQTHKNNGGAYENKAKRMVENASRGDIYYYSNIKCKCPGDEINRSLNGMVFNIR